MEKTLHDRPILFRRLRILQLATVSLITFAEIIQAIAFFGQLKDTQPMSFYFSTTTFNLCGIKLLYHIVIGLTLISTITDGIMGPIKLTSSLIYEAFGPKTEFLKRVLCDGYIFSTIFGWIMIIEFCISTVLYLRLWKTRNWWDNNMIVCDELNVENNNSVDHTNLTGINTNDVKNLSPRERHRLVLELGPRLHSDSSRTTS
ncbi:14303_t:CDS:2 [Funneliformis geosporum]|uniref:11121_t:CDS:1 n=1 Tax=Funneliformis geosporum TaxID=1117311 RepID=A0A9W4SJU4_9GLOM|nr:14303_t:CDS:2 [Funneliformis geosporum]CAI2172020.1 11121_t:CDS:2 [Funneliformis geosporum]